MIVVDTNVILRYLVGVRFPSDRAMYEAAGVLFGRVGRGIDRIVTNDAVVAEVSSCFTRRGTTGWPAAMSPDAGASCSGTPVFRCPARPLCSTPCRSGRARPR